MSKQPNALGFSLIQLTLLPGKFDRFRFLAFSFKATEVVYDCQENTKVKISLILFFIICSNNEINSQDKSIRGGEYFIQKKRAEAAVFPLSQEY